MVDGQQRVDATIYQGEGTDARDNLLSVASWSMDSIRRSLRGANSLDLKLNVDGILEVEVIEKHTGLRKALVIEDAFRKLSPEELDKARRRIRMLWNPDESTDGDERDPAGGVEDQVPAESPPSSEGTSV